MKIALAAAAALLLGLFLGGFAPKAELRRTREELSQARADAERGGGGASMPLALGMGSLFAARERAAAAGPGGPASRLPLRPGGPPTGAAPGDDEDDGKRAADGGTSSDGGRRGLRGLADPESFEKVKAAADLRAGQFRDAFVEEAHLGPEKQGKLDDVIHKMNEDFAAEADKMATILDEKRDKLAPRDMADIGVRLLQVYQRADDALRQWLTPEQVAAADKSRFDLLTQVDVASFRKLAEAAAKIENPPPRLR